MAEVSEFPWQEFRDQAKTAALDLTAGKSHAEIRHVAEQLQLHADTCQLLARLLALADVVRYPIDSDDGGLQTSEFYWLNTLQEQRATIAAFNRTGLWQQLLASVVASMQTCAETPDA